MGHSKYLGDDLSLVSTPNAPVRTAAEYLSLFIPLAEFQSLGTQGRDLPPKDLTL